MRYLDLIKQDMLNCKDFATKGRSVDFKDVFLLHDSASITTVFITRFSRFDGQLSSYRYALYDIIKREAIGWDTLEYQALIRPLPIIAEISYDGGSVSFAEKRRLRNILDQIVEKVYVNREFGPELKLEYLSYLYEAKKGISTSRACVYDEFIKIEEA